MKIDGNMYIGSSQSYGQAGEKTQTLDGVDPIRKVEEGSSPLDNQANGNENFPGEKQFIEAIEKSNKDLKMNDTSLKFSVHQKTKTINVKIIDNETKEVIREIPPEKILDMVAAMLERTGLFVDKKA